MLPRTVAVLGAGQMGGGIAHVIAKTAKLNVILYDKSEAQLGKQKDYIHSGLMKLVNKNELDSREKEIIMSRITTTTQISSVGQAQFCVEAVPEDIEIKKAIIQSVNDLSIDDLTFASNTSSIPITKLASMYRSPERFIGMHFMNPGNNHNDFALPLTHGM